MRNRDEEKKKRIPLTIILTVLMVVLGISIYLVYSPEGLTGNRIKNPDAYLLEIEKMNGEDWHTLELEECDALLVNSSIDKGTMNLEITDPDGQVIYTGNEKNDVDKFKINIFKSGEYTIDVKVHGAKGRISVAQEKK